MATSQVLIEHIEGTVAVPANTQSKQWAVNVDDGGGATDLSELVLKDSAGDEHTYITKGNVEIKISSAVSAAIAGLPNGVFVLATNFSAFKAYVESTTVYNIWAEGVDVTSAQTISVVSSKRIYSPSLEEGITISAGGFDGLTINFPTSGATNDIFIDFYQGVNNITPLKASGGYSGNPYTYKLRTKSTSQYIGGAAYAKVEYEINTSDANVTDNYASNALWSGNVEILKPRSYPWSSSYESVLDIGSQIAFSEFGFISGMRQNCYQNESLDWIFKGTGYAYRVDFSKDTGKRTFYVSSASLPSGSTVPWVKEKEVDKDGNVAYGELILPTDLHPDWRYEFNGYDGAVGEGDVVKMFYRGSISTRPQTQTVTGAYLNSSDVWSRYTAGYKPTRKWEGTDGTFTGYKKYIADDFSGAITWVELEAVDSNGNKSYNGAVIPSDVSTTRKHTFYLGNIVDIHYTDGVRRSLAGAYLTSTAGDSTYKSLVASYVWLNTETATSVDRYVSGPYTVGATFTGWIHLYNQSFTGSVNIKTGSTYQSTL